MAKASYRDIGRDCQTMPCRYSFRDGYIAGYIAVCDGGNGCVPPVVQVRYCNLTWLDQSCETEKMEAWFEGYELGALIAKTEGMTGANHTVTRISMGVPIDYVGHLPGHAASPNQDSQPGEVPKVPAVPPSPKMEPIDEQPIVPEPVNPVPAAEPSAATEEPTATEPAATEPATEPPVIEPVTEPATWQRRSFKKLISTVRSKELFRANR